MVDDKIVTCHSTVMPNVEVDAARAFSGHELGLPIWVRIWSVSRPVTCLSLPPGSSRIGVAEFAVSAISKPEQRRNITVVKHLRCSGRCFAQSNILSGNGEQFIFINTSQHEVSSAVGN